MESMVIGYCKCAKCGWSDGKFNWHVLFKCPECGGREYEKWGGQIETEQKLEEKSKRIANGNTAGDSIAVRVLADEQCRF